MNLNRRKSKKNSQVRYLRLMNNMSVSELAYRANINRLHLEKIEMGSVPCSELNARRIAALFGTPYEWERFVTKPVHYA